MATRDIQHGTSRVGAPRRYSARIRPITARVETNTTFLSVRWRAPDPRTKNDTFRWIEERRVLVQLFVRLGGRSYDCTSELSPTVRAQMKKSSRWRAIHAFSTTPQLYDIIDPTKRRDVSVAPGPAGSSGRRAPPGACRGRSNLESAWYFARVRYRPGAPAHISLRISASTPRREQKKAPWRVPVRAPVECDG
jgi:hypothetical protein